MRDYDEQQGLLQELTTIRNRIQNYGYDLSMSDVKQLLDEFQTSLIDFIYDQEISETYNVDSKIDAGLY